MPWSVSMAPREIEWSVADVWPADYRGGVLDSSMSRNLLFIARSGDPWDEIKCDDCGQAVMRIPVPERGARIIARTTIQPTGGAAMKETGTITDVVATDVDDDRAAELAVALYGPYVIGRDIHPTPGHRCTCSTPG